MDLKVKCFNMIVSPTGINILQQLQVIFTI